MKVLIYTKQENLKPVGGPAGYNYNLKKGIDLLEEKRIFINYLDTPSLQVWYKKIKNCVKKIVLSRMNNVQKTRLMDRYYIKLCNNVLSCNIKHYDFNDYDVVHFHSTIDMFLNKKNLEGYTGKVVLTSHSPKAHHREIIEDNISVECYNKNKELFDKMESVDRWCFDRADYIFFPCEESLEAYFNSWSYFKKIYELKFEKFRYIPTGISSVSVKNNSKLIREKYGIPENANVICFVGRHNATKGYDQLITLFKEIDNVYFLIAGGINKNIDYPKDNRWIEVGWTNDPYSIINASDLFILPNKQTYFDLVLLEVMSIGKPILLSNTGGNKYFKKYNCKGLFYFDNLEQAINLINQYFIKKKGEKELIQREIQELFNLEFESKKFAENYLTLLEEMVQ